ncbi:MAG: MarR family transcriptional regulator [Chthoniobacterales bacterium]
MNSSAHYLSMTPASGRFSQPLTKADYETLAAFRYDIRRFLRFSEEAARAAGLTPRHHQALLAIKGFSQRERVTIGELADQLQVAHHSAVGLVDRLASQNLVEREYGQEDRRNVYVRLSREGCKLLRKLSAAHRAEISRISPHLRHVLESLIPDGERMRRRTE